MARRLVRGFIWIPPVRSTIWGCTIDGVDIHDYLLDGSFPHGLISEELICEIELDNSGENFTDRFAARHEIIFTMDFSDGTTTQFKGELEEIKSSIEGGLFKYKIKGGHFHAQALDVMVTEEFTNSAISSIRTSLISTYLSGFTTTNVESNTKVISIKFVNKPLLDCLLALDIEGDEDTYFDFNKDVHSFKREQKNNDNEAVVWNDSLITLRGLGKDSANVRNKIQVIGEAGELPVLYTSSNSASQTTYRTKESVITDTSVIDETHAQALADSEMDQLANPKTEGSADTFFMPNLNPGDMVYVISPPHNVHNRFRLVKFVFKVPNETMEVFFNKERSIPKLFKDRIKKDLAQEANVNPYKMTHSYNFTFDDESKIDVTSSSGIDVINGNLQRESGVESGIMASNALTTPVTVNSVHLLIKGEVTTGATFYVQANSQSQFQQISINTLTSLNETNKGTELKLKIIITHADTRIDSAALLYKS